MGLNRIKVQQHGYKSIPTSISKDSRVSCKARGLYFTVMSLPEEWDFTVRGLISIVKEGKNAVYSMLNELISYGYVTREEVRVRGQFDRVDYTFNTEGDTVSRKTGYGKTGYGKKDAIYNTTNKENNNPVRVHDTERNTQEELDKLLSLFDDAEKPEIFVPENKPEISQGSLLDVEPRRVNHNGEIPPLAFTIMYRVCYSIETPQQMATLSSRQRGQIASTLGKLGEAGADFSDLNRFELYWKSHWRSRDRDGNYQPPTPQQVLDLWWVAMNNTQPIKMEKNGSTPEVKSEELSVMMQEYSLARRKMGNG